MAIVGLVEKLTVSQQLKEVRKLVKEYLGGEHSRQREGLEVEASPLRSKNSKGPPRSTGE